MNNLTTKKPKPMIKLSDYEGSHVMLDDEIRPREILQELLTQEALGASESVFAVDNKPVWGQVINAQRVWSMIVERIYDELGRTYADSFTGKESAARDDLIQALNTWASKHIDGTILVGTTQIHR